MYSFLYAACFIIGFLSGITTLLFLLKLFPQSPPLQVSKRTKQEQLNRVIPMTQEREDHYNDVMRSDL